MGAWVGTGALVGDGGSDGGRGVSGVGGRSDEVVTVDGDGRVAVRQATSETSVAPATSAVVTTATASHERRGAARYSAVGMGYAFGTGGIPVTGAKGGIEGYSGAAGAPSV